MWGVIVPGAFSGGAFSGAFNRGIRKRIGAVLKKIVQSPVITKHVLKFGVRASSAVRLRERLRLGGEDDE